MISVLNGSTQSFDNHTGVEPEIEPLQIIAALTPFHHSSHTDQDNNQLNLLSEIPNSSENDVTTLDIDDVFKANQLLEDEWGGEPPNKLRSWPSYSSLSSGYSSDSPGGGGVNPEELSLSHETQLASYDALGPTGKSVHFPSELDN